MTQQACLVVFTKPAVPGRVKTRLIGALSAQQAADLHAAFRDDLLERLAGGEFQLRVAWALAGEEALPGGPEALRQVTGDLGERLFAALESASSEHAWVAAVGSDHPLLSRERVEEAFHRLQEGYDIVLGPALDGGYYLVALGREALHPHLFSEVPWSTPGVLETTLARCRELRLRYQLLDPEGDVDTPADLDRLSLRLRREEGCPRTRQLLDDWNLLPEVAS